MRFAWHLDRVLWLLFLIHCRRDWIGTQDKTYAYQQSKCKFNTISNKKWMKYIGNLLKIYFRHHPLTGTPSNAPFCRQTLQSLFKNSLIRIHNHMPTFFPYAGNVNITVIYFSIFVSFPFHFQYVACWQTYLETHFSTPMKILQGSLIAIWKLLLLYTLLHFIKPLPNIKF